jgi:hypothetical protein
MSDWITITCPYCWSRFDHFADTADGIQLYVEDCQICCNPIVLTVNVDIDGKVQAVDVRRENG